MRTSLAAIADNAVNAWERFPLVPRNAVGYQKSGIRYFIALVQIALLSSTRRLLKSTIEIGHIR